LIAFLLHGATLTLACFLAINLLFSGLVVWIARREPRTMSPAFWFTLRILPAMSAAVFAAIVFVPSYWRYEPRNVVEGFDVSLTALALAAFALLGAGLVRGVSAWTRAKEHSRRWMRTAQPIDLGTAPLPALVVDVAAPMMALVGVWRPRLLVSRRLIEALTGEELAASVAHELGHHRAWDNCKRLAMGAAPDLLAPMPIVRVIERRWAAAAERAADRMNGRATPALRCALASALVKVARLTPPEPTLAEPISTLVGGGEIASRVEVLLDDRVVPPVRSRGSRPWLVAAIAIAAFAAAYAPLLRAVHELTEVLVQALP
jgi:Zn-dependent protease with chaperone function